MNVRFELPPLSADTVPAFVNAKACAEWLERLPLANPATAQGQLRAQVALLPIAGLKPAVLFDIVEHLREPVLSVQAELAKKFCFRPLPLADFEANALSATIDLWHAFGIALQVCVQSIADGERELRSRTAAVCQRGIDVQARLILDMLNAGNEVPAADWLLLHKLYRAAEEAGVSAEKVEDACLKAVGATHCMATYARPILLALGSLSAWGPRQAQAIVRWTERWANKVVITGLAPPKPTKPPVLVDLAAGHGGFRPETEGMLAPGKEVRYLDISALALSIKNRIIRLRKGDTPESLGLGEDGGALPAVEQTLIVLYKHLGDGRAGREHQRRVSTAKALAGVGIAAIHYYVSGKPFKQPDIGSVLSTRQMRAIATFGRTVEGEDDDSSRIEGFALEEWAMLDESVAGIRLARPGAAAGSRLVPGNLIAVRPSDARAFIMGSVRWVQMQVAGDLMIGVRTLPGAPLAVALRPAGVGAGGEKFRPGLLLPPIPALQLAGSVLLPAGLFRPGRVLDVHAGRDWQIRLDNLIERGADFERCSYSAA